MQKALTQENFKAPSLRVHEHLKASFHTKNNPLMSSEEQKVSFAFALADFEPFIYASGCHSIDKSKRTENCSFKLFMLSLS